MREEEAVQQRGFHNGYQNGAAVGFQVGYRSTYCRGIWLSMSKGFDVTVDGEKFSGDQVKVTVSGKTHTQEQMTKIGNVRWPNYEAAILTVVKPGVHTVRIGWSYRVSYIPGGVDRPRSDERKLVLVY